MPSENGPSQGKRGAPHRSARSQATDNTGSDSLSSTPPAKEKEHKIKTKHAVGHRMHTRVPSTRALQKLKPDGKAHRRQTSAPVSPTTTSPMKRADSDPRLSPSASATHLKPTTPHAHLRRNRSHVEVKKAKAAGGMRRSASHTSVNRHKAPPSKTSVHFDPGLADDGDEHDDGWTEASGSASPNISRSGSVAGASSGRSSAKPPASTTTSKAPSPAPSPSKPPPPPPQQQPRPDSRGWASHDRTPSAPDAHQITSRLLQRVPSHSGAAPKMSSISATATTSSAAALASTSAASDSGALSSGPATPHADSHASELISRFKGSGSGTPGSGDASPFLMAAPHPAPRPSGGGATANGKPRANHGHGGLDSRRAKSMSNLAAGQRPHAPAPEDDSDEERALAPRSRKASSTQQYVPPEQSRTQQKLWLQRASSNMEPVAQLAPAGTLGGLGGLPGGLGGMGGNASALVGAGFGGDGGAGGDPRVRVQLEKTGMAYLAVRRYQDPVARGLRRLGRVPGGRARRIPGAAGRKAAGPGLSQSLKEGGKGGVGSLEAGGGSFEGAGAGGSEGAAGAAQQGDEGLAAILRGLWERGGEMADSAE